MSNPKSTKRAKPTLEEIEEVEQSLWVRDQLNRIRRFLSEGEADCEMVNAVDYLIEDNERWIDPQIEEDLRSGKLRPGEA